MARRSNVRSRPRRTRRRISRRVRRGGTAAAELPKPPPGAVGIYDEVGPASDDPNATPTPPAEPVIGDQPFEPDSNSDDEKAYDEAKAIAAVEDDIKDGKLGETNSDDFDMLDEANKTPKAPDGEPEPEAPAPEDAKPEDAKPEAAAFQFPSFFGKQEKEPPIFKDIEPPPEAAPAAAPALPPAAPAAPAVPMPPDDLMERPRDSYLMGEQRVATRFPDFGLKKKRTIESMTGMYSTLIGLMKNSDMLLDCLPTNVV